MNISKSTFETDIFDFTDYRLFLKTVIQELKSKKLYKVTEFAKQAGIKTPGYMKMIIDGKRNLTLNMGQKFARALNIEGRRKSYFDTLISYTNTDDPDLKKDYFAKLIKLQPRSPEHLTDKKLGRYFSRPHYACIQEMVTLKDFKNDPKWIAERCHPSIKRQEAKEAIETLLELGALKKENGKLVQTQKLIQTKDKNNQIAETYHFHEAMIDKARQNLGITEQNKRNYLAVTLPVTQELFDKIVKKSLEFRDEVIKMVCEEECHEEIYQLNLQFFPMTEKKTGDKK